MANDIETETYIIIIFYTLVSIFLIGTIFNIIFLTKWGDSLRIRVLKRFKFFYFLILILVWLSIFFFSSSSIYIFSKLYYQKSKKLFGQDT